MRPLFNADAPGAAVLVAKNGKTMFRQGYGLADLATHQPIDPGMAFRLGSITKQFTAAAILLLVEQGKLNVRDDFREHLPGFPDKGTSITIEHLLTHTSGIPCFTGFGEYEANMATDMTVEGMLATFQDLPLEFTPGERFEYCNSGYFLLGAIIEAVSEMSYAAYLANNIFTPLGMLHTAYEGHQRNPVTQVRGYSHDEENFVTADTLSMSQPYAAGALVSTVDDLARWDQAISSCQLLPEASWRKAFTAYTLNDGSSTGYGYGWDVGDLHGSPKLEHDGGINGFATHAMRLPGHGLFIAVLTNSDSGIVDAKEIANDIAAIATR
ncbi:serine hydrolase [Pseudoduganella sp. DS3]|uniref:Serine hydrolase n=1 Tax=Pseudoduganella guangdongensis TaxID=2692179 RepID=A0A6N9HM16_9BURK|nr:serine hydrolase domain-containing protein [Pseudoduganella guangdongensis]MYN04409.1 serine hydrolase [Pseudoduganella guangdongensis]